MIIFILLLTAVVDDVVFETEQVIDFELILNDLEYLRDHPLDINRASVGDLTKIPFLALNDAIKIVEYRAEHGPYRSLDDLISIPGFDRSLIEALAPFLAVRVKEVAVKRVGARARLQSSLPATRSSVECYTRTNILINEYGVHTVTERDPYEDRFFDHYAAGLIIDEGRRTFALGKYNLDIGAGAMLSPVGSFSRGMDFRIMLNERGVVPFTSTAEDGGFFGAALSDSLIIRYTIFYSNQKLDGSVDSLGFARSLDPSGEHVDSLSSSRRDRINEEIRGFDLRYRNDHLLVAGRAYLCTYEPAFAAEDSTEDFYGRDLFMAGAESRYLGDNYVIFSEIARSFRDRIGGLFGISTAFPFCDVIVCGKYFPRGFYSPKGVEADPDRAAGILDLQHHSSIVDVGFGLTLDNELDEDTAKQDLRLGFAKQIGMLDARVLLRRRYRGETVDLSGSEVLLRLKAARYFFLDLRFEERTVYEEEAQRGIFVALEAVVDMKRWVARVRYGIFDTDTYASRIYAYEIDLPGVINNRMLYYKGTYGFAYVSVRALESVKVTAKYSVVNRDGISDRRIGCQVDLSI